MAQQSITLQTSDANVIGGDIIGRVNFAASNESSGGDALLIAASIYAVASGEFTSAVNPTNLVFATSDDSGAVNRLTLTNIGHFIPSTNVLQDLGSTSFKYRNVYAATGLLDRITTTGIQLTGSASRSGLLYVNDNDLVTSSPNVLFSNSDLASPKLIFKASGSLTPNVSLNVLTSATNVASGVQTLSVQGSAGELFSITDVLDSGTIFSVNDISGLELIGADADGTVRLVKYGTNVAIGNVTPTQKLHVSGNMRLTGAFFDSTNSPGTSGQVLISTSGGTDWRSLGEITGVDGVGTSGYVARWTDTDTVGTGIIYDNGTNVSIATTTTSVARLHVKGSGDGATNILNLENASGTHVFRVRDDGVIHIGPTTAIVNGAVIAPSNGTDNIGTTTAAGLRYRSSLNPTSIGFDHFFTNYQGSKTYTAGNGQLVRLNGGFNPSGGSSTYEILNVVGTINQVGGANGAVRGIYVNPTLTAISDYRAIETNNSVGWAFFGQSTANSYFGGNVAIGATSLAQNANLSIINSSATITGIIVRGAAAQTADLFQAQNNAGTTLFEIDAAGSISGVGSGVFMQRVGIATSNPQTNLEVFGTSRFGGTTTAARRIDFATDGVATFSFGDNSNATNLRIENLNTTATTNHGNSLLWRFCTNSSSTAIDAARISVLKEQQWTSTTSTQDAYFSINLAENGTVAEKFRITSFGDVGILPSKKIGAGNGYAGDTGSASNATLELYNSVTGKTTLNNPTYTIGLQTNSIDRLTILNNGNIGIGTTAPSTTLDVRGSGYFSDSIRTSGTIVFARNNTAPVGVMSWDDGEGTVSLGLKGGNINLEIGQEQLSLCYNGTASTIAKGKVVYINGAQGQRPSVTLASNDTEATSSKTLGIVAEDIASGAEGFVASYGVVRNLDTSAFLAGSGLWLGTSGNMTMTVPVQPLHAVFIGYALSINASSGRVFVRVQNGYELEELQNVLISSVASGDLIQYDSSSALWRNRSLANAGIVGGVGTSGYTARWNSANTITSGILYDNGTNIGIDTISPSYKFHLENGAFYSNGDALAVSYYLSGGRAIRVANASLNSVTFFDSPIIHFRNPANSTATQLYLNSSGLAVGDTTSTPARLFVLNSTATTTGVIVRGAAAQTADLFQAQNSAGTALTRIFADGSVSGVASGIFMQRLGIGVSNPAYGIEVSGDGAIRNTLYVGPSTSQIGIIGLDTSNRGQMGNNAQTIEPNNGASNLRILTPTIGTNGTISIGYWKSGLAQGWNRALSVSNAPTIPHLMLQPDVGGTMIGTATDIGSTLGIRGSGVAASTFSLIVQNSTPSNIFRIANDGPVYFGPSSSNPRIAPYSPNGGDGITPDLTNNARGLLFYTSYDGAAAGNGYFTFNAASSSHAVSNDGSALVALRGGIANINATTNSSYGIFAIAPTINVNTGTSTIRGIYYAPTVTNASGVTHRAIETTRGDILFQSNATPLFYVNESSGNIGIGTSSQTSKLQINTVSATVTGVIVRGAAAQTADLQQWQDSAGAMRASVTKDGNISYNTGTSLGLVWDTASLKFAGQTEGVQVIPYANNYVAFSVKGAASQSNDLTQWKTSGGTVLARVDAAGSISGVGSGIFMSRVGVANISPQNLLTLGTTFGTGANVNSTAGYALGIHHSGLIITSQEVAELNPVSPHTMINLLISTPAAWGGAQGAIDFSLRDRGNDNNYGGLARIFGGAEVNSISTGRLSFATTPSTASGLVTRMTINSTGNIGIGTTSPTQRLDVRGNVFVSGALYDSTNSAGTNGQVLTSTVTGTDWKSLSEITGVDGVGTSGYVTRWIDTDTVGTGIVYDNGTNVGISTASPTEKLDIRGNVLISGALFDNARSGFTHYYSAGNAHIIGKEFITEAGILFSPTAAATAGTNMYRMGVSSEFLRFSRTVNGATQMNNVFVISSGDRIGIRTASPATRLHIVTNTSDVSEDGGITIEGSGTGARTWQLVPTPSDTLLLAIPGLRIAAFNSAGKFFVGGGLGGTSGAGARFTASISGITVGTNYASATPTPQGALIEGFVGIGTTNPALPLHVSGGGNESVLIENTTSNETQIRIKSPTRGYNLVVAGASPTVGLPASSFSIRDYSAGVNRFVIDTAGNIGIGITSPVAQLHVNAAAATTTGIIVRGAASQSADLQQWQNSSATVLARVDAAGNISGVSNGIFMNRVGVGTSAPAVKLDVVGDFAVQKTDGGYFLNASFTGNDPYLGYYGGSGLIFATVTTRVGGGYTERAILTNAGNFGLGTTSPAELLTVYGDNKNIQIKSATAAGSNSLIFADTANRFEIYKPANSQDLRFKSTNGGVGDIMTMSYTNGRVGIGTTNPQYLLDVSGTIRANHVTAITKSFLIEHPTKPGRQLRYASLEGPENGVYTRGSASGNYITLPEYWCELVDSRSITVNLTPVGKYQQLWVKSKNAHYIEVGGVEGVYDYTVWAERKDVAKLEVET